MVEIVSGPIADHFIHTLEDRGRTFTPQSYRGMPYLWDGKESVIEWIEANIDHTGLTAVVANVDAIFSTIISGIVKPQRQLPLFPISSEQRTYLFGTFASDDDAILFKMRWEGAR